MTGKKRFFFFNSLQRTIESVARLHFEHFDWPSFVEKTSYLQEEVTPELLQSMREGVSKTITGVPKRPVQENDAIPKVAPKWLKHDR